MEEIAENLHISRRTVKAHIENCKEKLRCDTLFQLGQMYHKLELWRFF
jgi:DNA-binding NarL/FixJ family response regulator